ncbi:hypothetical protein DJ90_4296 [Paenibacillus macerans]|uniref:Uncharacterized protein n=1 Tax=Paenibacillus macerans TaxID=44252 RepID=A0A090YKH0_PAEMA|nr:hypothetical protein DJ90_4296 [Paenibacillus macerans]
MITEADMKMLRLLAVHWFGTLRKVNFPYKSLSPLLISTSLNERDIGARRY